MDASNSQQPHEDQSLLWWIPDECYESCEAAARSGLAPSPQEYWEWSLRGESSYGVAIMLEKLIAGIIRAHPASKDEKRNPEARLRDALSAIGGTPLRGSNARDDDDLLREMIETVEWDNLPDKKLRAIARTLLADRPRVDSEEESAVRRLVGKYKAYRENKLRVASDVDPLDSRAQHQALLYVQKALAAIGIPSKF